MVELFDVSVELAGEDAKRFYEYDKDPFKYETPESQKHAKIAREIAKTIYH